MATALLKLTDVQLGVSGTATNNFTWYQPAVPDGTVRLGNGNSGATTDVLTISSGGNLGLGVTPSAWNTGGYKALDIGSTGSIYYDPGTTAAVLSNNSYINSAYSYIYKTSNYATRYNQEAGQHKWYTAPSGTAGNAITFTQAMTLDASGNLGIGTSSPSNKLNVYTSSSSDSFRITTGAASGSGFGYMSFADAGGRKAYIGSGAGTNDLYISTDAASSKLIFQTADTERMRIDSSGNLLVGCTSTPSASVPGVSLQSTRLVTVGINTTANTYIQQFYNPNGLVGSITLSGSAAAYNTSSDYRLKENIQPMQNALGVVAQLNPVTYNWKANGSDGQGFIAHELQAVVPDCVTGQKDAVDEDGNPKYQGIDTSFLVATLTAAIKEQQALIVSLTTRLTAAEEQILNLGVK